MYNVYRPCNTSDASVGKFNIINQQWLLIKKNDRTERPHDTVIKYLIESIKIKQKYSGEIIITIDGKSLNPKGGIARLFRECKWYGLIYHKHREDIENDSHIRSSKYIDVICVSYNLLKLNKQCEMNASNERTISDHPGFF